MVRTVAYDTDVAYQSGGRIQRIMLAHGKNVAAAKRLNKRGIFIW